MSSAVAAVTPFSDRSRRRRLLKVAAWLGGIALLLIVLNLLGVDVRGWLSELWDTMTEVSIEYSERVGETTLNRWQSGRATIRRLSRRRSGVLHRLTC